MPGERASAGSAAPVRCRRRQRSRREEEKLVVGLVVAVLGVGLVVVVVQWLLALVGAGPCGVLRAGAGAL
ncbi:hypothetical protein ACH4RA_18850 [Streptomyces smyrnaeus]|uniref:hypothetical protein n=1 Tax=Streptomyces smyrnaeus TaxID=1387713 RepID=UPI003791C0A1